MNDLSQIAQNLLTITKKSDTKIMEGFGGNITRSWKNEGHFTGSVVTETDKAVDKFLRAELSKITPDAGFFTEETEQNTLKEYNWIIDPIDGTANFANKIPVFGTIISLWKDNDPQIGLISLPSVNEVILSVKGQGVFLNGKKITYLKGFQNTEPYAVFGFVGTDAERKNLLSSLSGLISSPANYYCTAMHTGLVATQRIDIAILMNLNLWDIAGGVAIAKELGVGVEFLSGWPDVKSDTRKNTHQLIIGDQELVRNVKDRINYK